jgi:S1-C subfamily serine protease
VIEPLLLTTTRIETFLGARLLTNASGFFFKRGTRVFLVTSRHVLFDRSADHFPDRIEIELHTDPLNLSTYVRFSIPLYTDGRSNWRQGLDRAGDVDIALVEINLSALPATVTYACFTEEHLHDPRLPIDIGSSLLVVGFPLGFRDTWHHVPVVRHAIVASSFGLRFQGQGYFLTDARTHRGSSGAPVVLRTAGFHSLTGALPWKLLGVHSSRLDMGARDAEIDEALGLNAVWYADILKSLTDD